MLDGLRIDHVAQSRLPGLDIATLPFGTTFTDHMFTMVYEDGAWRDPAVVPYGPIPIEPGVMTLHYSQSIFEGLKAYRGVDGSMRLFRPDMNARRLRASCEFLAIPPLGDGVFEAALEAYLAVESDWVPALDGYALYLRPLMFSIEPHLEVRPSERYLFVVIGAPVGSYFSPSAKGLSLLVETTLARVAPKSGLGAAKASANYAPALRASHRAREAGYDQVIWLDGAERRYVEEAGLMNIFIKIGGTVITPPLDGSILPGVTRDSALLLLREQNIPVEERAIAIDEVIAAFDRGTLEEVFATGTAAVVSPVGRIGYAGKDYAVPTDGLGETARMLHQTITGLQYGRIADTRGWVHTVPVLPEKGAVATR